MVPGTAAAQTAPGGTDLFAMMDGASRCGRDWLERDAHVYAYMCAYKYIYIHM